ncbi:MAG: phosphatase PAP2 family protein, partial [Chitinophagaceae bacterium]
PYITDPSLWHAASKSNPSFPSGHAAVTFVIATILSLNYRKSYIVIIFFAWAILVAFSRLDLGMHYPSDVIAGAFIGFIISWIVYKIFLRIREKYASPYLQSKKV